MNIDFDNLGKGFVEMLNKKDSAIMAFGMIPNHVFEPFLDNMYTRIAEIKLEEEGENNPSQSFIDMTKACITAEFKRHAEKELSKTIYKHAKMVV